MKKIAYIVPSEIFFYTHRYNLAESALKNGFIVELFTMKDKEHFFPKNYIPTTYIDELRYSSITEYIRSRSKLIHKLRLFNPDIIHVVTLRAILIFLLPSMHYRNSKFVFAISGIGSLFNKDGLLKIIATVLLRTAFRLFNLIFNVTFIYQNKYDLDYFSSGQNSNVLIPGSGIVLNKYYHGQYLINNICNVAFISRLLIDKGIIEYCESAKLLTSKNIIFNVYGDFDEKNPTVVDREYIADLAKNGFIKFHGYSTNVPEILSSIDIVVLPSYREGFPKILCEAAAARCSIITTNVPGCNEIVTDSVDGYLVPPKNISVLSQTIYNLAMNRELIIEFGNRARENAVKNFNIDVITKMHIDLYKRICSLPLK